MRKWIDLDRVSRNIERNRRRRERRDLPHRKWLVKRLAQEHAGIEELFRPQELAFANGFPGALWDVVVTCERYGMIKPKWARAALVAYAEELAPRLRYRASTKTGRSARLRTAKRQLLKDSEAYTGVKSWMGSGCTAKEAYINTAQEMGLTVGAIYKMVARHELQLKNGDFYLSTL